MLGKASAFGVKVHVESSYSAMALPGEAVMAVVTKVSLINYIACDVTAVPS
jgi:hypothetical protein